MQSAAALPFVSPDNFRAIFQPLIAEIPVNLGDRVLLKEWQIQITNKAILLADINMQNTGYVPGQG